MRKQYRYIIIGLIILVIIIYNIFLQWGWLDFDKTIYIMIFLYAIVFLIWGLVELNVFKKNIIYKYDGIKIKNKKDIPEELFSQKINYRTDFGDDTLSKIADSFGGKNKKRQVCYCVNCHREIYSSNYTGSNLCMECKKYYDKSR